jgi:hypothetical protein
MRVASNGLLPDDRGRDGIAGLWATWAHGPIVLGLVVALISVLVKVRVVVEAVSLSEFLESIIDISRPSVRERDNGRTRFRGRIRDGPILRDGVSDGERQTESISPAQLVHLRPRERDRERERREKQRERVRGNARRSAPSE